MKFLQWLEQNGNYGVFIIIGTMSGLIQISSKENKAKSKLERFSIWLTAFCFAVFMTPMFCWLVEIMFNVVTPLQVKFGICFLSGQFGEKFLIIVMRIYKGVNWVAIIEAIIHKKIK